jgi:hypothetical protein
MSGLAAPEIPAKIGIFRYVRRRLFTSVHGVSVVILWSVLMAERSALEGEVRSQATRNTTAARSPEGAISMTTASLLQIAPDKAAWRGQQC